MDPVLAGPASRWRTFMIARSKARLGAAMTGELQRLSRLAQDTSGATAVVAALVSTALIGFVGLGSETGLWYYTHRSMQAAADSGALGAAAALQAGDATGYVAEAKAAVAKYGFIDGAARAANRRPPAARPCASTQQRPPPHAGGGANAGPAEAAPTAGGFADAGKQTTTPKKGTPPGPAAAADLFASGASPPFSGCNSL